MALDKLVDSAQLDSDLEDVADAIRAKGGTSASLAFPAGFISAIGDIPTGGGGDYTANDWLDKTKPVGEVASNAVIASYANADNNLWQHLLRLRTNITKLSLPNATGIPTSFCQDCSGLVEVYAPLVSYIRDNAFYGCSSLKYAVFPAFTGHASSSFYGCSNMLAADIYGGSITLYLFRNCTKMSTLVIRDKNAVCSLGATNAFTGSPFSSGYSGGTLYVPASLISSYQSASNWSTILGYANNQIKSIESTHTDPTAPVDLTTHYVDGTLIPT